MEKLTAREQELIRITASDLQHIVDCCLVNQEDDDLRRRAVILRRLLVEGDLLRVTKLLKVPFYILATIDVTSLIEVGETEFYMSGGGRMVNVGIAQALLVTKRKGARHDFFNGPMNQKYNLEQFMLSPCLIYEGDSFNRIELIKYIANKSGGVHYEIEEKKLARMRALENAHKYMTTMGERSPIYYEMMSLEQALVRTKYCRQLLRRIKEEFVKIKN